MLVKLALNTLASYGTFQVRFRRMNFLNVYQLVKFLLNLDCGIQLLSMSKLLISFLIELRHSLILTPTSYLSSYFYFLLTRTNRFLTFNTQMHSLLK